MTYDIEFYNQINAGSIQSAHFVVNEIMNLFNSYSIVDFGCGEGAWLSVFKSRGCKVRGVDGPYIDQERLLIDKSEFTPINLPFRFDTRFDLAISLEVAEHLPESDADIFVADICAASNVVIFSAAIPGQKGVGHINEQWPSYWVKKFEANGFLGSEYLRDLIWDNPFIENWYRQNILIFMERDLTPIYSNLNFDFGIKDVVHPTLWHDHVIGSKYD